jgi:hypothetical protein
VGYEWLRQESTNGAVPVRNERHVVGSSQSFDLEESFADPATVILTGQTGAIVYQPGFDYRLMPSGDRISVIVLPQGRIAIGDTLLVDYEFRPRPTAGSQGIIARYGADVAIRWFRAYFRRDLRDLDDESSRQLLLGRDFVTVGVGLRHRMGRVVADLAGEYRIQEYNGTRISVYTANGVLSAVTGPGLSTSVSGMVSRERGTIEPLDYARSDLLISWVPNAALRLGANGGIWWWRRGALEDELFAGGGLSADLNVGLLTLGVRYQRRWWQADPTRKTDRLLVRLSRDF